MYFTLNVVDIFLFPLIICRLLYAFSSGRIVNNRCLPLHYTMRPGFELVEYPFQVYI